MGNRFAVGSFFIQIQVSWGTDQATPETAVNDN